jgi:hypothetical protein
MTKLTKLKFGWKYRKYLWRYRNVIRHRKAIGLAVAGTAVAAGILWSRPRIEKMSGQPG